jgi:hypothetical protein
MFEDLVRSAYGEAAQRDISRRDSHREIVAALRRPRACGPPGEASSPEVTLATLAVAPLAFAVCDRATARVTATGRPLSVPPGGLVNVRFSDFYRYL